MKALKPQIRILATGFKPFAGWSVNSSEWLVKMLKRDKSTARYVTRCRVLPVEYDRCFDALLPMLKSSPYGALVCFGLSGEKAVVLERVARNRNVPVALDEAGESPSGAIVRSGPKTIESTLPLELIAKELSRLNVPWRYSEDAGGYVCNNLFYHVMHNLPSDIPRGFIHVPPLDDSKETRGLLQNAGRAVVSGTVKYLSLRMNSTEGK